MLGLVGVTDRSLHTSLCPWTVDSQPWAPGDGDSPSPWGGRPQSSLPSQPPPAGRAQRHGCPARPIDPTQVWHGCDQSQTWGQRAWLVALLLRPGQDPSEPRPPHLWDGKLVPWGSPQLQEPRAESPGTLKSVAWGCLRVYFWGTGGRVSGAHSREAQGVLEKDRCITSSVLAPPPLRLIWGWGRRVYKSEVAWRMPGEWAGGQCRPQGERFQKLVAPQGWSRGAGGRGRTRRWTTWLLPRRLEFFFE